MDKKEVTHFLVTDTIYAYTNCHHVCIHYACIHASLPRIYTHKEQSILIFFIFFLNRNFLLCRQLLYVILLGQRSEVRGKVSFSAHFTTENLVSRW